jgi:flagellar motor switch protein FliM
MDIEVDLKAVVDVVTKSVGEIMSIRAGDVIQLNAAGLDQLALCVEERPKFIGKAAQRGGNKVFVVAERCE